jgi:hypothetical protein
VNVSRDAAERARVLAAIHEEDARRARATPPRTGDLFQDCGQADDAVAAMEQQLTAVTGDLDDARAAYGLYPSQTERAALADLERRRSLALADYEAAVVHRDAMEREYNRIYADVHGRAFLPGDDVPR